MVLQKSEWYLFVLAAFTLSLIYYVAFRSNAGAIFGGFTSLVGGVMGRNASGAFQAPF